MGEWPKSLIHEIAERRVVFFIGAGVSICAYSQNGKKFPNWNSLLLSLADGLPKVSAQKYVKKLIKKSLLLDAAQVIHDTVPAADFSAALREQISNPDPIFAPIYEDIVVMDPKIIVTTNYDTLLEKNYEHFFRGSSGYNLCRYNQHHALEDIRSPIRSILKAHGCISEPQNIILGRSSYFDGRRNYAGFFNLLASIATINTVLFLGYSFSDPDIQLILENVNISTTSKHPHYALVPKFGHASIRSVNSETYNIHFIEFPDGQYDKVPALVKQLRDDVAAFRSSRGLA